jgi:hypothetical protein
MGLSNSVRPEPVEGLPFFGTIGEEVGQGFDKLSPSGICWSIAE